MPGCIPGPNGYAQPYQQVYTATVIPGIHEAVERRIDGRRHRTIREQAIVVGRPGSIGPLEDVDMLGLNDVGAEFLTDHPTNGLVPKSIQAGGPSDQELAEIIDRDRKLLAGMVLGDHRTGSR
jgi:hypothetical protein